MPSALDDGARRTGSSPRSSPASRLSPRAPRIFPLTSRTAFEQRYGVAVLPSYGATEFAGGVAGWNLALHRKWATAKRGSVGRPQQRPRDPHRPDRGRQRGAGRGTGPNRGPHHGRRRGYAPPTSAAIDADGFVFVDGRIDDVIIRGGFKVSPGRHRRRCCAAIRRYTTPESPASPTNGSARSRSRRSNSPTAHEVDAGRATGVSAGSESPLPGAGQLGRRRRTAPHAVTEGQPARVARPIREGIE